MLNTIYPRNISGESLFSAIKKLKKSSGYVIHLGCGKYGEAVLDLSKLGFHNLIGIDFATPNNSPDGVEFISMDLSKKLPIKDGSVNGLIFGSYLFRYLSPELQLQLLEEIDRISGKGSKAFLGPFYPPQLINTKFEEKFRKYKNPLYGFIMADKRKSKGWTLYRSRIATFGFLTRPGSKKSRRGLRLPLFSFYDMGLRSLTARLLGNAVVSKDYRPTIPNEYFITFVKD